jgi:hypothetical protein
MNIVRLQIFSANAVSRYRNELDASAAKPRDDQRKLGLLVSLAQPPGIECATYRAKKYNSGPIRNGLIQSTQHSRIGVTRNSGVHHVHIVALAGQHLLQLRRKSLRTVDHAAGDITGAEGNDLGLRHTGKAEHHPGKQPREQK